MSDQESRSKDGSDDAKEGEFQENGAAENTEDDADTKAKETKSQQETVGKTDSNDAKDASIKEDNTQNNSTSNSTDRDVGGEATLSIQPHGALGCIAGVKADLLGVEIQKTTSTPAHRVRPDFTGKWQMVRSDDNAQDYLAEVGIPWLVRKMVAQLRPMMEIRQLGDKFRIQLNTFVVSFDTSFTIGEEFEEKNIFGHMKIMPTWDGDKLVSHLRPVDPNKGKEQTMVRELIGGELVQTMICGEITTRRYFQKT